MCHRCCSADNCNNNLCAPPSQKGSVNFMLVMDSDQLYEIDVATNWVHQIYLPAFRPQGLVYDYVNKSIIWYDSASQRIFRQPYNSTQYQRDDVIYATNGGIAIDAMSKLLFYINSVYIHVLSLETGKQSTVIDMGQSIPQWIALDVLERKMYWADRSGGTIEVANYNGTNRHTVISSGLQRITIIAFDDEHKVLYWGDSGTHKIERANTNGTSRQTLAVIKGTDYTGLALLGNYVYYTSTNVHSVMRIPISGGLPEPFGKSDFTQLYDVKGYDMSRLHLESNPCSFRNGGCSHVCIPTSDTTRECLCPTLYQISTSGTTCIYTNSVRLAGYNATAWKGRTEFTLDKGATWNTFETLTQNDAKVICKMLGFKGQVAPVLTDDSVFGNANDSVNTYQTPACIGTEETISDCQWFQYNPSHYHQSDAGVHCNTGLDPLGPDGQLRLSGSIAKDQGRVEILINNLWGTVCDDNFGPSEAGVVCGSLGFSRNGAQIKSSYYFGPAFPSTPIHLDNVKCIGNEDSLFECKHNRLGDAIDCKHKEDVGVICQAAKLAQVRLVGSSAASNQGLVEISTDNGMTWNTVCHSYFRDEEAQVVCHMLGFNRIGASAKVNGYFGQGNSSSKILSFDCYGPETSLLNCKQQPIGLCSHSDDAGVICPYTNAEQLRLVNGSSANQGRVEISLDNGKTWGTVCSQYYAFNNKEASVICVSLGYAREGATSKGYNFYGPGSSSQPVFMQHPDCIGTETSIFDCKSASPYSCSSHLYDVGVMCLAESTTLVRLQNYKFNNGRVEISVDNGTTWGTICNDYFRQAEAEVVCRMLGFNVSGAVAVTNGTYGAGATSQQILFDDLNCSGDETSLLQCQHKPIGENDCTHDEDVGVACSYIGQGTSEVRLSGSYSRYEGRVEVKPAGTTRWGTLCSSNFDSNEASVICAMLGFQRSGAVAKLRSYFGPGLESQPILLGSLECTGRENTIFNCSGSDINSVQYCVHSLDAGVICQP